VPCAAVVDVGALVEVALLGAASEVGTTEDGADAEDDVEAEVEVAGADVEDGAFGAVGLCAELDEDDGAGLAVPSRLTTIASAPFGSLNPLSSWNFFTSNASPSPGIFKVWISLRCGLIYIKKVNCFSPPVSP
jgi:hypothetical protein